MFSLPEALASCILSHTQQPVLLGMKNLGNYNIEQAIYLIVFLNHSLYVINFSHLALLAKGLWICYSSLENPIPWCPPIYTTPIVVSGKNIVRSLSLSSLF